MNNLILLANEFPYGNWEPYLETEIKYYGDFNRVYICSLQLRKEHKIMMRHLSSKNIKICEVEKAPSWVYFLYSVTVLRDINFYKELRKLMSENRFNVKRLIKLVVYLSRSHYEAGILLKYLKKENIVEKNQNKEKIIEGGVHLLLPFRISAICGNPSCATFAWLQSYFQGT